MATVTITIKDREDKGVDFKITSEPLADFTKPKTITNAQMLGRQIIGFVNEINNSSLAGDEE